MYTKNVVCLKDLDLALLGLLNQCPDRLIFVMQLM
jgi:hypothetical protein